MMQTDLTQPLFAALQQGGLLLCANRRLSRTFRDAYDRWMQSSDRQVWPTPRIFEIRQWSQLTLSRLQESAPILSHAQTLHLWEDCIRQMESESRLSLLQVSATAQMASKAHTLLTEYGVSFSAPSASPDQRAFLQWRQRFQQRINEEGWIDPADVFSRLIDCIDDRQLSEQQVWLAGFDDLTPVQQRLERALTQTGAELRHCASPDLGTQPSLRSFEDTEDEIRAAAQWARRLATTADKSVAIVSADSDYLRRIERIFTEEIDPAALFDPGRQETRFDFSQGGMLADEGPVHAALELLSLMGDIDRDRWSWWLRTPYLGRQDEMPLRLQLDRLVREQISGSLDGQNFKAWIKSLLPAERCRTLIERLDVLLSRPQQPKSPAEWIQIFDHQLVSSGWPGSRSISSREFQALSVWRETVLPTMASLQVVRQQLSHSEAIAILKRLAAETPFQMETPRSPIQILGLLETGGLQFDAVWVLGATEDRFPALPAPNPFIPVALQTAHQMPHCDHEREHAYAAQTFQRLADCAPEVVFSLPQWQGSEPQQPSPLLSELFPNVPLVRSIPEPAGLEKVFELQGALDSCDEPMAPALKDVTYIPGGTGVLKDQAQCPFRAFAHYRLGVTALGEHPLGVAMSLRGSLMHRLLERFWAECQSSENLNRQSEGALASQLERLAVQIVDEPQIRRRIPSAILRDLEAKRLVEVGVQWLVWEQKRPPFVVEQTEARHELTLQQLLLKTTLDRVDRLEEGGQRILIDYKTGISRAAQLSPERLEEPQLPLYARTLDPAPEGVAIAQVRRQQPSFSGICRASGWLPGVTGLDQPRTQREFGTNDWDRLLQRWSEQLDHLAQNFCRGDARVAPVDGSTTCTWCDLQPLCRISEINEAASCR